MEIADWQVFPFSFSCQDVQHLSPATDFYKKLALDCSGQQVAVDLFLLSAQYCDLASLGEEKEKIWPTTSGFKMHAVVLRQACILLEVAALVLSLIWNVSCCCLCFSGCISRFSAGSVYYYPSYHHQHNPAQVERFQRDLKRYLTRKIGFEAVMRIRCTKGKKTSQLFISF